MKNKNQGYDPNVFKVSRKSYPVAYLPGVGRFCECGCNKPLIPKQVTYLRDGKRIVTLRKLRPTDKYATRGCRQRDYRILNKIKDNRLSCRLDIKNETLSIYISKNQNHVVPPKKIKIKKSWGELYEFIQQVKRYTILEMPNLIEQSN